MVEGAEIEGPVSWSDLVQYYWGWKEGYFACYGRKTGHRKLATFKK